jgi:hypothetical protein
MVAVSVGVTEKESTKTFGGIIGQTVRVQYGRNMYVTGVLESVQFLTVKEGKNKKKVNQFKIKMWVECRKAEMSHFREYVVEKLPPRVSNKELEEALHVLKVNGMTLEAERLEKRILTPVALRTVDCMLTDF